MADPSSRSLGGLPTAVAEPPPDEAWDGILRDLLVEVEAGHGSDARRDTDDSATTRRIVDATHDLLAEPGRHGQPARQLRERRRDWATRRGRRCRGGQADGEATGSR